MISFAICDDEPWMAEELSCRLSQYMDEQINKQADKRINEHLSKNSSFYSIRCFSDGCSLLKSGNTFDVIFLDIQMPPPDGLETARKLRRQGIRSLLIFITVLAEYVFDAFSVEAYDYLVKPLEDVRFRRTMNRVLRTLSQRTDQQKNLIIQKGNSCEIIPLSEILYGEVMGRKIYIHQINGSITDYYGRMEDLERKVDGRFFKCHRSYLVNLAHVRGCHDGRVILMQDKEIPVSRLRERDLTQALLHYMKSRTINLP